MDLDTYRKSLDDWLDEHAAELAPVHIEGADPLSEHLDQFAKVKRLVYDAGWSRWGWPERVGGSGGSTLLRAYLAETLTARDLVEPGMWAMIDTLLPTLIDYASPELAVEM